MNPKNEIIDTFKGVWTAIVTPFLEDFTIDWTAYENLISMQSKAGITGIVVAGSTGEGLALSIQEKLSLIKKTRALVRDRLRVMANIGTSYTQQSVELARLAVDAGADSLLVVTPPYCKPTIAGLMGHYEAIAEAAEVPICLYHVPSRTGLKLSSKDFAKICSIPNVVLAKEATGDLALFSQFKLATPQTCMLTGDDLTFLPSLSIGGHGVISVLTNVFPKSFVELMNLFSSGRLQEAQDIHDKLFYFMQDLFCESNPGPVKAALYELGLIKNVLRLPLAPVTFENQQLLHTRIKECREIFQ